MVISEEQYQTTRKKLDESRKSDLLDNLEDGTVISTIFLGEKHKSDFSGAYETMVFDRNGKQLDVRRYATAEEAKEGHEEYVEQLIADRESHWVIYIGIVLFVALLAFLYYLWQ